MYKVLWCLDQFLQSYELQSFEFDVCDVIPANVQNISPWFSLHICIDFMQREPLQSFMVLLMLGSFE